MAAGMQVIRLAAVLFFALVAGDSHVGRAQDNYDTGAAWLELCTGADMGTTGKFACFGYFKAVDHFAQLLARGHPNAVELRKTIGCIPQGVDVGQVTAVVVKHLREHPERLHLPFIELLLEAQRKAFPCP